MTHGCRMLQLLAIGCLAGMATALMGVGGGMLLLVMLLMVGVEMPQAVATSLVLRLVPITIPTVYVYYQQGHIRIPFVLWVVAGSVVGTLIGSWLISKRFVSDRLIGQAMTVLMAGMTGYMVHRYCWTVSSN